MLLRARVTWPDAFPVDTGVEGPIHGFLYGCCLRCLLVIVYGQSIALPVPLPRPSNLISANSLNTVTVITSPIYLHTIPFRPCCLLRVALAF
jgi:hypothetical protein